MENESKKDRNMRKMREDRFAKQAKIDGRSKKKPKTQEVVQEDWTLEEDLPEEEEGEPAWKSFEDKPQWKKFDENLPPGLAKKEDEEKKPKKKKGKKKDETFSDW